MVADLGAGSVDDVSAIWMVGVLWNAIRLVVDECEDMICSFMADNYDEPAAVGVFMMLSGGPSNEVSPLVRRILDAAPEEFLNQSYVNGYISRTGYARN